MSKEINDMTISEIDTSISDLKEQLDILEKNKKIKLQEEKDKKLLAEYNFYQEIINNGYKYNNTDIAYISDNKWECLRKSYNNTFNKYIYSAYNKCREYRDNKIKENKEKDIMDKCKNLFLQNSLPINDFTLKYRYTIVDNLHKYRNEINSILSLYLEIKNYPNFNLEKFLNDLCDYLNNKDKINNIKLLKKGNISKNIERLFEDKFLEYIEVYYDNFDEYDSYEERQKRNQNNIPFNIAILTKICKKLFEKLFRDNIIITKSEKVYSKLQGNILYVNENGFIDFNQSFLQKMFNNMRGGNNELND